MAVALAVVGLAVTLVLGLGVAGLPDGDGLADGCPLVLVAALGVGLAVAPGGVDISRDADPVARSLVDPIDATLDMQPVSPTSQI